MNKTFISAFLGCLFALPGNAAERRAAAVTHMTTEYESAPLAIDEQRPRLSWQLQGGEGERGRVQKAFRIRVTDESGHTLWDSGKRQSAVSLNVPYAGAPLMPGSRYRWTVTSWTNKGTLEGSSTFETGLNLGGQNDWDDARWIGGGDDSRVLYAPYLNVYQLRFTLQLMAGSERAALVYGANEERLMNSGLNYYHLQRAEGETYMAIELDTRPLAHGGEALLNLYRAGYRSDDRPDVPLHSVALPSTLVNKTNQYAPHQIRFYAKNGDTHLYVDGTDLGWRYMNPLGEGHDIISLASLCDMGFKMAPGQRATFSNVEIRNWRSPENVLYSKSEPQTLDGGQDGLFTTFSPSHGAMPRLRTTFRLDGGEVERARLYITARGIYDLYMNGARVSDGYFNPGLTQYNKTHQYQTFDVTDLLRKDRNAIGIQLGEGWWSGAITYTPENWNFFGDRQSLLAKLVVTFKDGRKQEVVSRPGAWRYAVDGPVVYSSFFNGEVYDARRDAHAWTTADYDDTAWRPAEEVPLEGNVSLKGLGGADDPEGLFTDYSHLQLSAQTGQGVKAVDTLTALSVESSRPGLYIYDMGQNMAAVPLVHFRGLKPGTVVRLRFAEMKYPDLPDYAGYAGEILLENIRAARAQDTYIARGGDETFSPRLTFHGFRYLEISGVDAPLPTEDVKAIAVSSIDHFTADYMTSNALVNRLWKNVGWSYRSNFVSIPTDCPQRNERMGWCGDISVFSRTATYMGNVPGFLRRYLQGMRDIQPSSGLFPDVAPVGGGFGGLLWGSAGITVTWEAFRQYADTALLREHYPAMQRYIGYVQQHYIDPKSGLLVQEPASAKLGDWLSLEYERGDRSLLWECYYIYDLQCMAQMADVLGRSGDATGYRKTIEERKALFKQVYLDPVTKKTRFSAFVPDKEGQAVDIQSSYVLPLAFGVVKGEDAKKLMENLETTITRENTTDNGRACPPYSLMTGFIGTAWINHVLSDQGRPDLAYRLLQQTAYPSWLYSVEQGATTIWERLNSYTQQDGFGGNNSMNSFNHYSFGAIGSWMIDSSLGIARDPEQPAMQHFLLQPEPDPTGQMTFARGYEDTPYGRIESAWEQTPQGVTYRFSIPANTSARLTLPAVSTESISESGKALKKGNGYGIVSSDGGKVVMDIGAGDYTFYVKK